MSKFGIVFLSLFTLIITSCAITNKASDNVPSWYVKPKQNDAQNFYGVSQGYSLEESTKYALVDAASRLMVSVSSQSNLLREENRNDVNEEMVQKVKQNIEKIDFTNFKVTKSEKIGAKLFTEVQIERSAFIQGQKETLVFLEKQVADLDKNSVGKNPIQKRLALIKILDLEKQIELSSRILAGAGEDVNLKEKLNRIANFQNQFNASSDNIEFYFDENSPKEIAKIIRAKLNKEKIKVAQSLNSSDLNQILVKINSNFRQNKIYGAYMTKLAIDFENLAGGKAVASNAIEVTGSSSIGEKESYAAALQAMSDKIDNDGILKTLGIIN